MSTDYRIESSPEGDVIIPRPTNYLYSCWGCRDTGAVLARDLAAPTGAPYAFRCDCGRNAQRAWPRWRDADKRRFEAIRYGAD